MSPVAKVLNPGQRVRQLSKHRPETYLRCGSFAILFLVSYLICVEMHVMAHRHTATCISLQASPTKINLKKIRYDVEDGECKENTGHGVQSAAEGGSSVSQPPLTRPS